MVREARRATVCGVTGVGRDLATTPPPPPPPPPPLEKIKHCRTTYIDAVIQHFRTTEFLNVQIYITVFVFLFPLAKIVKQKQCHTCGGVVEVHMPPEVFGDAWVLIFTTCSFNLHIWLTQRPLVRVNISRLSVITYSSNTHSCSMSLPRKLPVSIKLMVWAFWWGVKILKFWLLLVSFLKEKEEYWSCKT